MEAFEQGVMMAMAILTNDKRQFVAARTRAPSTL